MSYKVHHNELNLRIKQTHPPVTQKAGRGNIGIMFGKCQVPCILKNICRLKKNAHCNHYKSLDFASIPNSPHVSSGCSKSLPSVSHSSPISVKWSWFKLTCAFSLRASVEYDVRGSQERGSSHSAIFASCRKPTFIYLIEIIHFSNCKLSRIEG